MLEGFRSLLLNLPENPKYGKTRACQLLIILFSIDWFFFFIIRDLSCPPPTPVFPCSLPRLGYIHHIHTLKSIWHFGDVSRGWKYCFLDLECEHDWNNLFGKGGSIHHSCSVKVCIDLFILYTLLESFSAGFMYWLLCNSWTKHRVELIFKEKRLYSICFVTSFCK